jgi:hypothetical protein
MTEMTEQEELGIVIKKVWNDKWVWFANGIVAGVVIAALGLVFATAMNIPTMAKSNATQKCVYVLTPDGKKPCSFIREGDKYDTIWVK